MRLILKDNEGTPWLYCKVVDLTNNGFTFLSNQKKISFLDGTTNDKIMNLTFDEAEKFVKWYSTLKETIKEIRDATE